MSPAEQGQDVPEIPERGFLSIGEVLDLLKGEYPDVTISKIRFLESQGLIDPERTPSGYRKFHAPDVERLRWILHQQREHFLPLKVIKEKLATADTSAVGAAAPAPGSAGGDPAEPATPPATPPDASDGGDAPEPEPERAPAEPPAPARRPETSGPAGGGGGGGPLADELTSASLNRDELLAASGLTSTQLDELERYGLVGGRPVAGQVYYDGDALVVATLAVAFGRHGVEARHLRMYKTSAEREAGFYEQVVLPLVKQRNPRARAQAVETLAELARLGESLRGALLREALRGYTTGG